MSYLHRPACLFPTLLALSLSTGLSACTQQSSPTSQPSPVTTPAMPSPSFAPSGTPTSTSSLTVHLQADASLAGFATAQQGPFALCLGRIAFVETRTGGSGQNTGQGTGRVAVSLKKLLAGIDLSLQGVAPGRLEGRTLFFDAAGTELGFVSWQANISGTGGTLSVLLRSTAGTSLADACPQLVAEISGGTLLATGGQVIGPNPGTTPSPGISASPTASPVAAVPELPAGLRIVEQTSSSLTLQWEFGAEAVTYNLFLDGGQVATNHTSPNYYRFESLSAGSTHTLGVQAVNAGGSSSVASLSASTLASGHSGSGNFSGGGSSSGSGSDPSESSKSIGAEFLVSSINQGRSDSVDVAMNEAGQAIAVWHGPGQVGENVVNGVFGQRYTDGEPVGEPFAIDTNNGIAPAVAMDTDGNFVVTWAEYGYGGVNARRYDAQGEAEGPEIVVTSAFPAGLPDIALDTDGEFVIVWRGVDSEFSGIQAQRYDAAGGASGSAFVVNSLTQGTQSMPAIAMDSDGNYVVTWASSSIDDANYGVSARFFNGSDQAPATEFRVNTYISNSQTNPAIAMAADGDYVIAWSSLQQEGDAYNVYAQRYSVENEPRGEAFRVNRATDENHSHPAIVMDEDGNFIVAWQGTDGYESGIITKHYTAGGRVLISEYRVNTLTSETDVTPSIAMDADGDYLVLWTRTYGQYAANIFGARYSADATAD